METEPPDKPGVTGDMAPEYPHASMEEHVADERSEGSVRLSESCGEHELKGIIEALLFVSRDPLSLEKIIAVLAGPSEKTVQDAMQALRRSYDQEDRGIHIAELAGGYLMMTQPDCAPWITKLTTIKASAKVSRSALETLAIIAYRQPIVRAEIEHLRGVETSGVLRTLLDHKLVRIVGRKDIPGRPILYGTSRIFLRKFGLRDLRDLPSLREFKALGEGEDADLFDAAPVSNGRNDTQETDADAGDGESCQDVQDPTACRLDSSIA